MQKLFNVCWLVLALGLGQCATPEVKTPKQALSKRDSGIGLITLKDEARKSERTTFDFYEGPDLKKKSKAFDFSKTPITPTLQPEFYAPEADICYFLCAGWDPDRYYVIVDEKKKMLYLPRDTTRYRFIRWEEFLPNVKVITRLEGNNNTARLEPLERAPLAPWDDLSQNQFNVLRIKEKWMEVEVPGTKNKGWIKWVTDNRFFINFEAQRVKALSQLKGFEDPSAKPYNNIR
ncbi:MAG: hypothetical protein HC913_07870 [Microscillaceae bacterium]|nr:hypothetical protein [Microscillaceae bacterium]